MKITSPYIRASVITPAVILVILIIYLFTALKMSMPIIDRALTESFFPVLISIIGITASGKLLAEGIKESRLAAQSFTEHRLALPIKPILIVLITAVFIFLFEILGFMIITPIYIFFFMLIYDDKVQKIPSKFVYSILIAAATFLLYEIIFNIRFPEIWR